MWADKEVIRRNDSNAYLPEIKRKNKINMAWRWSSETTHQTSHVPSIDEGLCKSIVEGAKNGYHLLPHGVWVI